MTLKRFLWFSALAFFAFFVMTKPALAAGLVKEAGANLGTWFQAGASSLVAFFSALA